MLTVYISRGVNNMSDEKKKNIKVTVISIILAVLAFLMAAVMFSSCGKKSATAPETTIIETEKQVDDFVLTTAPEISEEASEEDNGLYAISQNEDYELITGYELE